MLLFFYTIKTINYNRNILFGDDLYKRKVVNMYIDIMIIKLQSLTIME